jgi:hypothetical protein
METVCQMGCSLIRSQLPRWILGAAILCRHLLDTKGFMVAAGVSGRYLELPLGLALQSHHRRCRHRCRFGVGPQYLLREIMAYVAGSPR